jgi:hypothetical protein
MKSISKYCTIATIIIAVFIICYDGRFLRSQYNSMNWDAYSYYLYLPATFIHGTPFRFDFHKNDFEQYPISSSVYQFHNYKDKQAPFFTMGVAICLLPFFLLTHWVNLLLLGYPADGLSLPYQIGVLSAALSFLGMGLFYIRRVLLTFCGEIATSITILALALGTNLLYYSIYDAGLSHVYLFGLYAFLLYKTLKWHENPSKINALWIGATLAILCLVRPSEILAAFIPLLYGIYDLETFKKKWILVKANWIHVLLVLGAGILVIAPQLIYWKLATGHFVVNAYADRGDFFDFKKPHIIEGLIGYRKGWFVYTPLMAFAFLGFFMLWKQKRTWFWAILTYSCLNFGVLMCYHMWHFASCFGNRALIQSYAALALPLCAFVSVFLKQWKGVLIPLVFGCIFLNLFQTWQYVNGILPFDNITKNFYWRTFGETKKDRTLRKYLQLNDFLPNIEDYTPVSLNRIEQNAEVITSEIQFSKASTINLDDSSSISLSKQWIQFSSDVYFSGDKADEGNSAKAVLTLSRSGKDILWTGISMQQCYPSKIWNKVDFEVQMPDSLQKGDLIKAYIWSQSPDSIWMRSIGINVLKKD